MALAVVRDLGTARPPAGPEELAAFETDVLAGFVLARASAGLADGTIRGDMSHLEQIRNSFGRPLWEMRPADADAYFGRVVRSASQGTRLAHAQSLSTFFDFLEMRYRAELHAMTGTVITSPLDEMNRPRGRAEIGLRIPPVDAEIETLFTGWREELATCRKFATAARNFTAAQLISKVGLRINEARCLDLDDVRWELGRFGKLHVRFGKGTQGSGPRHRVVPLINGADRLLRWYIEDVWGHFDHDHTRPGAPLFPSERHHADGSAARAGAESLRRGLAHAVAGHLPTWTERLTPHVLRHFCASQLYRHGMDLLAIQELLGHWWVATTMRYVNPRELHQTGEFSQVAC
ncbi:tyrosine-type recombinase/integrase [Nocardia amamiensis]|uniref:tyrosine-type recombinase/integrase n=1 Tax=Nocardia amamiensis TaxID=404578 RepID=UPI0008300CC0|nr:site-specific integrase [Nocardia amamiensis]